MTFADIPAGSSLFLDANILVYHFVPHPAWGQACRELLAKVARQELVAYTSTDTVGDAVHRTMVAEAMQTLGYSPGKVTLRLKQKPADVMKLGNCQSVVADVLAFGVQVLPVNLATLQGATQVIQRYGLLTNDALVVAVMQQHNLTQLASNDPDFDRIPGITRYAPG